MVILSNIPLPGLPISQLVSLEELLGEVTPRMLVEDLVCLSLDRMGFTCFYDIIDPLLSKKPLMGKAKVKRAVNWLKANFQIESKIAHDDKPSTRTLRTYFYSTVNKLGLLKMKLISEDKEVDRNYVNIYAHKAEDVEASLRSVGAWVTGKFRVEKYPKAQQDV